MITKSCTNLCAGTVTPMILALILSNCADVKSQKEADLTSDHSGFGAPADLRQRRNFATCPKSLSTSFESRAPRYWLIIDCNQQYASFELPSKNVSSQSRASYFFTGIFLDKRYEQKISRYRFSDLEIEENITENRDILRLYPDHPGFIKYFGGLNSFGFDIKRNLEKRFIVYWNKEKSIFCYGVFPGDLECFWGNPSQRYVISFHSDDFVHVMRYVSHINSGY